MKVVSVAKVNSNEVGFKIDITKPGLLSNLGSFLNDFDHDIAYYNRNFQNPMYDVACTIVPCKGEKLLDAVNVYHANFFVAIQQDGFTKFECLSWAELAAHDLVQKGDDVYKPIDSFDIYQLEAANDKDLFAEIFDWVQNYGYTFSKFEFCDNCVEIMLDDKILQINHDSILMINSDNSISVYDSIDELTDDDFIIV